MNSYEYRKAKKELALQKSIISKLRQRDPTYGKEFMKLIELLITVKGHAWSMDVKNERRKMARLLTNTVEQLR